jgi:tetratricopeptide (TPR) repeat protein
MIAANGITSRKKLIFFSIAPLALLCALLTLTEIALRVFAPALRNPLVSPVTRDSIDWYLINRGYLQKYFPATVTALPEFKPALVKQRKTVRTFRVLCVGESSMFGTPYAMDATIPAILRKQLRHLRPDRDIEVVNLGAAAVNSNVLLDITEHLFDLQPDLILLYVGHNEFYGPDGVGASFLERHMPFTIPLKYSARDLLLVRMMQNFLRQLSHGSPEGERNMMRQVSENSYVRLGSSGAERVIRLLESNLTRIAGLCRSNGVPLIVSDVTSNLLFPPFAFDSVVAGRDCGKLFASVPAMFDTGNPGALLAALSPLFTEDSSNAFVAYWLGRIFLARGDNRRGRELLERARDNDLLKFRAPGETNAVIRNVCRTNSVPLVSSDSLFLSFSPSGVPGDELFWEHLHPNARGYYEIAGLFLQQIIQLGIIRPGPPVGLCPEPLPFNSDSLSIPWLDHAYAEISVRSLTARWPFRGSRAVQGVLDTADNFLRQIATDVYTHALGWDEGCYRTAAYFGSKGAYLNARTTYESLIEENPYDYRALYMLGNLEKQNAHGAGAAAAYRRAIAANPRFELPRIDLALLEINAGEYDDAIRQLRTADSLTTGKDLPLVRASIFYGLSASYANKGDFAGARLLVREALRLAPSYGPAQVLMSELARHK